MYNFITIMYDVFSYFGVLAKNQNTHDIQEILKIFPHINIHWATCLMGINKHY